MKYILALHSEPVCAGTRVCYERTVRLSWKGEECKALPPPDPKSAVDPAPETLNPEGDPRADPQSDPRVDPELPIPPKSSARWQRTLGPLPVSPRYLSLVAPELLSWSSLLAPPPACGGARPARAAAWTPPCAPAGVTSCSVMPPRCLSPPRPPPPRPRAWQILLDTS